MKAYFDSKTYVSSAMSKKDNLTDRISNKIAVIHLTVKMMNDCFGLQLNADEITDLLIGCDQMNVEDRDPAKKALECIESYIYDRINDSLQYSGYFSDNHPGISAITTHLS